MADLGVSRRSRCGGFAREGRRVCSSGAVHARFVPRPRRGASSPTGCAPCSPKARSSTPLTAGGARCAAARLPRAAGKFEAADKIARRNGEEAVEAGADAIVTACMSCVFQLNMAQPYVQALHFLELLYSWRIDWARVGGWMKYRFLFDETLGVVREGEASGLSKGSAALQILGRTTGGR